MSSQVYTVKVTYADGFEHIDIFDFEPYWLQFHDDYNLDDILQHIKFVWTEGNYSCDCNRSIFRYGEEGELPCGHTIVLKKIEATAPDGKVYLIEENC